MSDNQGKPLFDPADADAPDFVPSEPAGADVYSHPSEHGERITDTLIPDLMIEASGGVMVAADTYGDDGPLVLLQHGGGPDPSRLEGSRSGPRRRRLPGGVPRRPRPRRL